MPPNWVVGHARARQLGPSLTSCGRRISLAGRPRPRRSFRICRRHRGHRLLPARRGAHVLGATNSIGIIGWRRGAQCRARACSKAVSLPGDRPCAACCPRARQRVSESENWILTTRESTVLLTVLHMLLAGMMSSVRALASDTALVLQSSPRCPRCRGAPSTTCSWARRPGCQWGRGMGAWSHMPRCMPTSHPVG